MAEATSHNLHMFRDRNSESWISCIEQYFYLHEIPEASEPMLPSVLSKEMHYSGLRADIRLKIQSHDARTLSEAIQLAKEMEHEVESSSETRQWQCLFHLGCCPLG